MKKKQLKHPLQPSLHLPKGVCEFALQRTVERMISEGFSDHKRAIYCFLSLVVRIIHKIYADPKTNDKIQILAKYCIEFVEINIEDDDYEVSSLLTAIDGDMGKINRLDQRQVHFLKECLFRQSATREKVVTTYMKALCCLDVKRLIKYYANQGRLIKSKRAGIGSVVPVTFAMSGGVSKLIDGVYMALVEKSLVSTDDIIEMSEFSYYVTMVNMALYDMMMLRLKRKVGIERVIEIVAKYSLKEGEILSCISLLEENNVSQVASLHGIYKKNESRREGNKRHDPIYGTILSEARSLWGSESEYAEYDHTKMRDYLTGKYKHLELDIDYLTALLSHAGEKFKKKRGGRRRIKETWR